jgi:two-component system, chemotaxis family, protein-glutamate methylesterase/glutaminase
MVKVLIIDDSAFQRKILSNIPNDLGHDETTEENGKMGIERSSAKKPDVLITDLLMPEYDGFWVQEPYMARKISMPVIIVTSDIRQQPLIIAKKWELSHLSINR